MSNIPTIRALELAFVVLSVLAVPLGRADSPSPDEGETKEENSADRIVGRWQLVKAAGHELPKDIHLVAHFDSDGKITVGFSGLGQKESKKGAYQLDGNKLTITIKGQKGETNTIKSLDDSKLVLTDTQGKEVELKKVK
jgi:uncharacterized protein (TIGR03066 family)